MVELLFLITAPPVKRFRMALRVEMLFPATTSPVKKAGTESPQAFVPAIKINIPLKQPERQRRLF